MYPIPPNETLVETKVCKHCGQNFPITNKDLEFYEKVSPTFAEKKYLIPTPTLCPDCRQQRRLSFRNERKLYKRKCDATGRDIISIYSPDKPFKVYHQDFWWSDKWDPMEYGRDFDFERGFFEQLGELIQEAPRIALFSKNSENSEYTNHGDGLKNSYMTLNAGSCENAFYGNWLVDVKNSVDNSFVWGAENSYQTINSFNIYKSKFCFECQDVSNCSYLYNSIGCRDCFLSGNLTNARFVFDNVQYQEWEYNERVQQYILSQTNESIYKEWVNRVYKNKDQDILSKTSENFIGNNIIRSSHIYFSNWIMDSRNVKYSQNSIGIEDGFDITESGFESSRQYESHACNRGNSICFGNISYDTTECQYIDNCHNSSHLFACIGLRNKSYCIFNKQYTKEQYEELVPRIIEHMMKTGEWGEFFPSSLSSFGYNETIAGEFFLLTKEQALSQGFNWSDYEAPFPKVEKIIPANKLPEDITKIPDDILNWAIECEVTKKPFRIIKQELDFYRKHNLPIPHRHPDQRHLDRMALRNPRKLFERKCDKCGKDMITTYSPERPEIVYCEECYNREVVG